MTALDRITEATGIVAALVNADPIYRPVLERLKQEAEAAKEAAMLASARPVIRGRRLKAQAA